jgi:hypothetical protein
MTMPAKAPRVERARREMTTTAIAVMAMTTMARAPREVRSPRMTTTPTPTATTPRETTMATMTARLEGW